MKRKKQGPHQHFAVRCVCTEKMGDCGHPMLATHVLDPCIHKGTANELFESLVSKTAKYEELDPNWVGFAVKRIGEAWQMKPDDVFFRFRDEVAERTGSKLLPGTMPN